MTATSVVARRNVWHEYYGFIFCAPRFQVACPSGQLFAVRGLLKPSEVAKLSVQKKRNMGKVVTLAIVSLIFLVQIECIAQGERPADYLTPDFHVAKREELRRLMPPNSVAVFFANAERNRANDGFYIYHQDPNFYYLTGHREPHAVLFIFKEPQTIGNTQTND